MGGCFVFSCFVCLCVCFCFFIFLFCLIVCGFWLLLLFFGGLGRFFAVVCPCVCVREGVNICVKVKLCTFYDFYQRCERHHFNIYFVNFTFVNFTFSNFKCVYFKTFVKIVTFIDIRKKIILTLPTLYL